MERTLCIIKPDAVRNQHIGNIVARIQEAGFRILGMKQITISKAVAGEFYAVHKERPFYGELVDFMSSGPIVPIALGEGQCHCCLARTDRRYEPCRSG